MSPLFETIKVVNSSLLNLDYHNARVNKSRKELFKADDTWDLGKMIILPELISSMTYKCRFVYHHDLIAVEIEPYTIKPIGTLKLLDNQDIEYSYKYLDRSELDILKHSNLQTDDIIIVQNQRITDVSYANIAFYDGDKWFTPATPLLRGTKRQKYIDDKAMFEADIKVFDLRLFKKARIINAMIDLDESPDIPIANIF